MRCATENQGASNQELVNQRMASQSRTTGRPSQGAAGRTSGRTRKSRTGGERADDSAAGGRGRLRSLIGWLWGREMFGQGREAVAGRRSRLHDVRPGGTRALALERCEAREVFAADLEWFSAWQNPTVSADVVPDGIVTPADLLRVANALATGGEHALPDSPFDRWGAESGEPTQFEYLDVTGDGWLTNADFDAALEVLEAWNAAIPTTISYAGELPEFSSSGVVGFDDDVVGAELLEVQAFEIPRFGALTDDFVSTAAGSMTEPSAVETSETSNEATVSSPLSLDGVPTGVNPGGGPGEMLSISLTGTGAAPGGVFGLEGAPSGGAGIEIADGPPTAGGAAGDAAANELRCVAVPAVAGPVPSFILDSNGAVRAMTWRPAWTAIGDAANVGLYIDDFDSPYISPATRYTYTDDNNKIAPKVVDVGFQDDTHFAWLEAVGYRSYYVATHLAMLANTTPVPEALEWSESVSITTGTSITNTVSIQIGAEFGAELEGIAAKVQAVTSGSITVNEHLESTESRTIKVMENVPACSVVGLYKLTLVTEVQWDYAMMYDTVLGPMYGFEREMGRFVATSKFDAGHRAMFASGRVVKANGDPVPVAPGPVVPAPVVSNPVASAPMVPADRPLDTI